MANMASIAALKVLGSTGSPLRRTRKNPDAPDIAVKPKTLVWTCNEADLQNKDTKCQSKLMLTNNSGKDVCYKIKTTNPKRYSVSPAMARIDANCVKEVSITLTETSAPPEDKREDRFLVQVCWMEDPTTKVDEFWKGEQDKNKMYTRKVKSQLIFEEPDENDQFGDAEAEARALADFATARNDRNDSAVQQAAKDAADKAARTAEKLAEATAKSPPTPDPPPAQQPAPAPAPVEAPAPTPAPAAATPAPVPVLRKTNAGRLNEPERAPAKTAPASQGGSAKGSGMTEMKESFTRALSNPMDALESVCGELENLVRPVPRLWEPLKAIASKAPGGEPGLLLLGLIGVSMLLLLLIFGVSTLVTFFAALFPLSQSLKEVVRAEPGAVRTTVYWMFFAFILALENLDFLVGWIPMYNLFKGVLLWFAWNEKNATFVLATIQGMGLQTGKAR